MFPGLTTKISEEFIAAAATINPKTDLVRVNDTTSTTAIVTINPSFGGGQPGVMFLVNDSGNPISFTTAGNINAVRTIPDDMSILMVYSKLTGKWYPGAIS